MYDDESDMGCIPIIGILIFALALGIILVGVLISMNNAGLFN
jgi:hypothetical protein